MPQAIETTLKIALVLGLQIIVYAIFLQPKILTWGVTQGEANMPLIGDDLAPRISATRAITINVPISEVWLWLTQLGADRGGFFSYSLLEKVLGYETREAEPIPEFRDLEVGRIIPTSVDESKSVIKFDFSVVAVEPGKSYVLKNWGAFVLKEISPARTRLIVRTHGQETPNLLSKISDFIGVPMHYIMERRMLMGFKAQAEVGEQPSSIADNLWLVGLFFSAVGIALLVFAGEGVQAWLSVLYSLIWLWTLLILAPRPIFSMILLLIIVATTVWLF